MNDMRDLENGFKREPLGVGAGDWPPEDLEAAEDFEIIVVSRAAIPALTAALRDVLALHRPLNDLGSPPCATCLADDNGEPVFVPYPCPTVRAITAHVDPT